MEGCRGTQGHGFFAWVRTRKACDNPECASRSERQLLSFLSPKCSLTLLLLPPSPSTPIVPVSTQTRPCRREGPLHLPTHQFTPIACKRSTVFFVRISYVIHHLFTTFTYFTSLHLSLQLVNSLHPVQQPTISIRTPLPTPPPDIRRLS